MKKQSMGSRLVSLLLAAVMLVSMIPVMGASAATIDAEGYLGNVKLLNNDQSITLPIKLNNFAMDGMMFEYLSSISNDRNAQYYLYETGGVYQLFTLHLANKKVGVDNSGNLADKDGVIQPDSDAMSANVNLDHSLTSPKGTTTQNYKGVTSGGVEQSATAAPYEMTDGSGAKYLQLRQYNRTSQDSTGRAWRKLTRFSASRTIGQSRYAVIIYRVNGDTTYDDMLLTWDYCNELSDRSNCSQTVDVAKGTGVNWQYTIIDLAYELGQTEEERAAAAATTKILDLYLQTPLDYDADKSGTRKSLDLAAVAYFPYYGDAEQFVHYGLTMGCAQKYYHRDNRGFDFINATRTSGNSNAAPSVSQWDDTYFGNQLHTNSSGALALQDRGTTGDTVLNTVENLSYALFGQISGTATMGLLESQLGENGRPVYKEVAVDFVAAYLQNRLTAVEEYPSDNYGWKNFSFVTGVSTTSSIDDHLFGKDDLGRSVDLATALCQRISGAKKGGGALSGTMGTYEQTRGKANELIGTWEQCQGNIETWYDAAYYLLHNLYVSNLDTAYDGDGYGEYEDDYRSIIMQQVNYKNSDGEILEAYAFDSGFCKNNSNIDSAVIYDRNNHTLSMDAAANLTGGKEPFLPTSGTGTETGETNSPYYVDDYVIQHGRGYRQRDYHFTISGNGSFQYERDLFFQFKGDDDVYLFINGQLVLDIGGTHSATLSHIKLDDYVDWAWAIKNGTASYKGNPYSKLSDADRARVDALALKEGMVCSLDFFYMERHGAGSNLSIVTNIEVTAGGLNVDKTAYQNGVEIAENGIVDVREPIEYGFRITNDSDNKLNCLTFCDTVIGVSIDYENGLVISEACAPYVRNANGNPLTPADLQIYVTGKDANGQDRNVVVTCRTNEELKSFLADLTSDDGTQSGDGLWKNASVQIRGIYYTLTEAQKQIGSFHNYVSATAVAQGFIYRGTDNHTVYQPGKPAYYQWVGKPIVIERGQLYRDLLDGVVSSAADLPALGNMILVPSDADGVECQDNGLVNTRGGDVYLEVNYTIPRTYVAYVTIRDQTDLSYRLTVPITIYATDTKDSAMVLDYGLDAYLTDDDAIFDYELDLAVGEHATGTVMGIADQSIEPSYQLYDTDRIETAIGNTENNLTLVNGTYEDTLFTNARLELDSPIYLEHTKPWVIEFVVSNLKYSSCLFSMEETRETDGNLQLYLHKTGTLGHITLGAYSAADGRTNNYGVQCARMLNQKTHVKLYNVPAGDGTNMVYCSVDGNAGVAMTNVYHNGTKQNQQDSTWISGRDFTFRYLGCKGSPNSYNLQLNMDHLYVYEAGEQLVHYRWQADETGYSSKDTEGCKGNTAADVGYTYNDAKYNRWELSSNVVLSSDRAWEVEFEMQLPTNSNFMLFSSTEGKSNDKTTYVYLVPGKRFISMGSNVGGTYINYGAILPTDFDMTAVHTYLLKNRIRADGTNMVYLYVDRDSNGQWTEVGPLDHYSKGSNIGVQSDGLSGKSFSFRYIGGYGGFGFADQVISYLEVREDTALRTAYAWTAEAARFTSVHATGDGNRIEFAKEESGIVTDGDGKFTLDGGRLKFEAADFMDQAYTAYIALTIHDPQFVPTPLNQTGVNVAKEVQMYKKVSVIPANVVYYEDDFPAIHYLGGNANVFTSIGDSTLDQLQSPLQDTEYGSDAAYGNASSDISGGHITKIAICEEESALAWFAFRGTGFELVSSTNATDSPIMYLDVYNKADVTIDGDNMTLRDGAKALAWIPLTAEFDHGNDDGEEVITQVPIVRWQRQDVADTAVDESCDPGDYVVVISAYALHDYTQPNAPLMASYLYIDGIRIYQPMGYENEHYNETENRVLFEEVRNQIIDGKIMACEKTDEGVTISSGTVTWTENLTGLDHTGTYYEGNQVASINDYLLKGPNNEVYMEGSETKSSLAFVVYRNGEEAGQHVAPGLQIGVRAIDAGSFYGSSASGRKANLELGVTDGDGTNSWMLLETVSSGTEQYISIPYELCPAVVDNGIVEYHVVLRVTPSQQDIPAMISFSGLKRGQGLELKEGIGEAVTIYQDQTGQWVTSAGENRSVGNFLMVQKAMATEKVISFNEAVRGENFQYDPVTSESVPGILPKYPSLSFESEVQYNIYFTTRNMQDVAPEDMGLITFETKNENGTMADAVDVIGGAVMKDGAYMVHTNGIPAKKLGDELYFKVYAKLADGSYVYSNILHYSAVTYAKQQLAGNNEAVKPLVVAMLNYGAAAQTFFGYNTDHLMNAELTDREQALVQSYHPDMAAPVEPAHSSKVGVFVGNDAFSGLYPSVSFGSAFAIHYYAAPAHKVDGDITLYFWDAATYNSVTELTAENAVSSKRMTAQADLYTEAYTGIAAKEIGDTVYMAAVYESEGATCCSGVIAYSLSRYCKGFAEDPSSDLQGLAAATTVYGCCAQQYFAQ